MANLTVRPKLGACRATETTMKRWIILAIVLAVLLLIALALNLRAGMALGVLYLCGACLLSGWVLLPPPAFVTRFWAWLGLVDRAP